MDDTNPVFDFVPFGGFLESLADERLKPVIDEADAENVSAFELFDLLKEEQVRQLQSSEEYRDTVREIYKEGGVNLISPTMSSHALKVRNEAHPERVRQDLARWQARFDSVDWMCKVTSPAQARHVINNDCVGVLLNTQNIGQAIQGDIEEIERLYNFGIKMGQLTYNAQNLVGSGCYERTGGGLSNHGEKVVQKMNDLDMIIDLSHCGKQTTLDAIDLSNAPTAFTHTFSQSIAPENASPRGKSDAELEALADSNGYVGILGMPSHYAPGTDPAEAFEIFFDQLDHVVDMVGVDRVGIGTDWGVTRTSAAPNALTEGYLEYLDNNRLGQGPKARLLDGFGPLERFRDWQVIPETLAERGYSSSEIDGICGENFMRYWERVVSS